MCQARPSREAAFLRGALGPAFQVHLPRPVRPERSPSESRRHARRLLHPTWHLPSGAWGPGGSGLPRCWGSTRTSHEAPRPPCPLSPPGGALTALLPANQQDAQLPEPGFGGTRGVLSVRKPPSPTAAACPRVGMAERAANSGMSAAWFSGTVVLGSGVTWLRLVAWQRARQPVSPVTAHNLPATGASRCLQPGLRTLPEPWSRAHRGASRGTWAGPGTGAGPAGIGDHQESSAVACGSRNTFPPEGPCVIKCSDFLNSRATLTVPGAAGAP